MATIAGATLPTPRLLTRASHAPKITTPKPTRLNRPWNRPSQFGAGSRAVQVRPLLAAPEKIAAKVEESIKAAQETCSDDPASGECVAAWDEVEELSAAASHARDRTKESDPLEEFCKDNMSTDECRTYED